MDKNKRKQQNRSWAMRKAKVLAKEKIRKKEEMLDRKLTREEKENIFEKVRNNIKRQLAVRIAYGFMGLAVGLGGGIVGTKLLNEANNKGITKTESTIEIDTEKTEKDVVINNKNNEKEVFLNGIKVDLNKQENEIKSNLLEEIDKFETKDDVLDYIKNIYVEKYNQKNGTDITAENITIEKDMFDASLEEDKAANGDTIMRKDFDGTYEQGIYTVRIETEEGLKLETFARTYSGDFVRVYYSDDKVESYEENTASENGSIIASGTDYAIAIGNKETSKEVKDKYKERLIDACAANKKEKINKIIYGENQNIEEKEM